MKSIVLIDGLLKSHPLDVISPMPKKTSGLFTRCPLVTFDYRRVHVMTLWWFPARKMGVALVIICSIDWDFPWNKQSIVGLPHDELETAI